MLEDFLFHPMHPKNETEMDVELECLLLSWDKGRSIPTISMGGLGPGYEQCIHLMAFEMLRILMEEKPPRHPQEDYLEAVKFFKHRLDAVDVATGCTGAQWSAAQNVAARFYRYGYTEAHSTIPEERRIYVSQTWPKVTLKEETKA
jgi:hypothetical protein